MNAQRLCLLIDSHSPALQLYARQLCSCAEDVVQEAFVKLAGCPREPDHVVAWLYRVVRNAALSAARSDRRRKKYESSIVSVGWFVPNHESALDAETLQAALATLPVELREVVVAHIWGELSFAQIGSLLNISSSTAHRRYLDGLRALRERLRVPCPKT
jgi:RNA polymerase sigma-70 factor (ECF subfamily)